MEEPQVRPGTITVFYGPMFAGKTSRLLNTMEACRQGGCTTLLVKPRRDTRSPSNRVTTHDKAKAAEATAVASLSDLGHPADLAEEYDVIGIDEGQFFPDLHAAMHAFADAGLAVVIASLDLDSERKAFVDLTGVENPVACRSTCAMCGSREGAAFTFRHRDDASHAQVQVGGDDKYMPMCRACFNVAQAQREQQLQSSLGSGEGSSPTVHFRVGKLTRGTSSSTLHPTASSDSLGALASMLSPGRRPGLQRSPSNNTLYSQFSASNDSGSRTGWSLGSHVSAAGSAAGSAGSAGTQLSRNTGSPGSASSLTRMVGLRGRLGTWAIPVSPSVKDTYWWRRVHEARALLLGGGGGGGGSGGGGDNDGHEQHGMSEDLTMEPANPTGRVPSSRHHQHQHQHQHEQEEEHKQPHHVAAPAELMASSILGENMVPMTDALMRHRLASSPALLVTTTSPPRKSQFYRDLLASWDLPPPAVAPATDVDRGVQLETIFRAAVARHRQPVATVLPDDFDVARDRNGKTWATCSVTGAFGPHKLWRFNGVVGGIVTTAHHGTILSLIAQCLDAAACARVYAVDYVMRGREMWERRLRGPDGKDLAQAPLRRYGGGVLLILGHVTKSGMREWKAVLDVLPDLEYVNDAAQFNPTVIGTSAALSRLRRYNVLVITRRQLVEHPEMADWLKLVRWQAVILSDPLWGMCRHYGTEAVDGLASLQAASRWVVASTIPNSHSIYRGVAKFLAPTTLPITHAGLATLRRCCSSSPPADQGVPPALLPVIPPVLAACLHATDPLNALSFPSPNPRAMFLQPQFQDGAAWGLNLPPAARTALEWFRGACMYQPDVLEGGRGSTLVLESGQALGPPTSLVTSQLPHGLPQAAMPLFVACQALWGLLPDQVLGRGGRRILLPWHAEPNGAAGAAAPAQFSIPPARRLPEMLRERIESIVWVPAQAKTREAVQPQLCHVCYNPLHTPGQWADICVPPCHASHMTCTLCMKTWLALRARTFGISCPVCTASFRKHSHVPGHGIVRVGIAPNGMVKVLPEGLGGSDDLKRSSSSKTSTGPATLVSMDPLAWPTAIVKRCMKAFCDKDRVCLVVADAGQCANVLAALERRGYSANIIIRGQSPVQHESFMSPPSPPRRDTPRIQFTLSTAATLTAALAREPDMLATAFDALLFCDVPPTADVWYKLLLADMPRKYGRIVLYPDIWERPLQPLLRSFQRHIVQAARLTRPKWLAAIQVFQAEFVSPDVFVHNDLFEEEQQRRLKQQHRLRQRPRPML